MKLFEWLVFRKLKMSVCTSIIALLFTACLNAQMSEDLNKLQHISTPNNCFEIFQSIVNKKLHSVEQNLTDETNNAISSVFSSIEYWRSHSLNLGEISWDLYPKLVKAYSLLSGFETPKNQQFIKQGFAQGVFHEDLITKLLNTLDHAHKIPFSQKDCDPNYLKSQLGSEVERLLNTYHDYYMLNEDQIDLLAPILLSLKQPISDLIGTPWRITNIRIWETHSDALVFGPNDWHTDGLPLSMFKIMIYPKGASVEQGTTELLLADGSSHVIEEKTGSWLLFKSSEIYHRGLPPKTGSRLIIEVSIIPSLNYDLKPVFSGLNSRHPILPWQYPQCVSTTYTKNNQFVGINIGGGPHWTCPKWLNLEEVSSASNPHPFYLHPNCMFPVKSGSIKSIYTSHALEHLNIPTVHRVFSECCRSLEEGGNFLIKIPDYDKALDCWKRKDPRFFGSGWNLESITHLWKNRGIYDCVDYRAAMIFCSFFNQEYGNPFGPSGNTDKHKAYFGPPVVDIAYLRDLIQDSTPSEIAAELRNIIYSKESNAQLCHQSAWSREELQELLNKFGFEVISFDPDLIINTFGAIPGMDTMKEQSTFCWAKKKSNTTL